MSGQTFTVAEIAQYLQAEYVGNGEHLIQRVASLENATPKEISFFNNSKFRAQLDTTQAGCVLLSDGVNQQATSNYILVADPYLSFAKVSQLLDTTPVPLAAIHESARISPTAKIGKNVSISAGVVIEDNCSVGDNVILGANTVVGQASVIGANTRIYANVSIYHSVTVGERCLIHAGAVIGADGFGFANEGGHWVKIPQTGGVIVGDDVEVGANTCIDRGALNDTLIGNGVKLDNLCHIAHNVELGEHVAMAAYAGVAGSTKVGDFCTFSGRSTILGHLSIAPRTHVTACSVINRSNQEAGVFSSGTGMQDNKTWRKNVARFRQLDEMAKQIKALEKRVSELSESND